MLCSEKAGDMQREGRGHAARRGGWLVVRTGGNAAGDKIQVDWRCMLGRLTDPQVCGGRIVPLPLYPSADRSHEHVHLVEPGSGIGLGTSMCTL